jgi:ferrous iron transport protein B
MLALIVSGGIAGGCAVPGVMATRTLREPRERLVTIIVAPLLNCGAKLPVYILLIAAFFPAYRGEILLLLTVLAWLFVALASKVISATILRGPPSPFVMELPPYRVPTFRGLLIHMWERTWEYIKKAGTILLAISIIFWALMTFPRLPDDEVERMRESGVGEERIAQARLAHSVSGRVGGALARVTDPLMGFDWRTDVALLGGFAAKEVIVTTLGTAYSLGESEDEDSGSLSATLAAEPGWSPLVAFALMVFTMLYAPCFATLIVMWKETGTWRWPLFALVHNTLLAVVAATLIYQGGLLLGLGG